MAKGEIARFEQYLLSPHCLQKLSAAEALESVYKWERVKQFFNHISFASSHRSVFSHILTPILVAELGFELIDPGLTARVATDCQIPGLDSGSASTVRRRNKANIRVTRILCNYDLTVCCIHGQTA